jgi:hypothetical protein
MLLQIVSIFDGVILVTRWLLEQNIMLMGIRSLDNNTNLLYFDCNFQMLFVRQGIYHESATHRQRDIIFGSFHFQLFRGEVPVERQSTGVFPPLQKFSMLSLTFHPDALLLWIILPVLW